MKKLLLVLFALLILFSCENQVKTEGFSIGLGYYKIIPGTPEWKELKNHNEMLEATQLPKELINSISTNDLAEACLAYPLLGDMRLFNDLKTGVDKVTSRFNGLQELINRKDSAQVLLSIYKTMDPNNISSNWSDNRIGQFSTEMSYIELLMSQDKILNKLNLIEKRDLIKTALDFSNKKLNKSDIFGLFSYKPGVYLIARTLIKTGFKTFTTRINSNKMLKSFVQVGPKLNKTNTVNILNQTIGAAKDYLKINKGEK